MQPRDLPPAIGSTFSVADALELGLSPERLRRSDLTAPFYGVRMRPLGELEGEWYEQQRQELVALCRAFVPVAPLDFRFSHVTAALLYGMPLPYRVRSLVLDVSAVRGLQPPRGKGIRGHRSSDRDARLLDGLPLATPERVWFQLASLLTVDELVVAGDFLVRRKFPLSTMERLIAIVQNSQGERGRLTALAALRDIRVGTDSPRETETRLVIVRAGLPEPVVHFEVLHEGAWVGTPDLAYVRERIAIEYQGKHHQTDRKTYLDDIDRREMFQRAGWKVIEVTDAHLALPHWIVSRVSEALRERAHVM